MARNLSICSGSEMRKRTPCEKEARCFSSLSFRHQTTSPKLLVEAPVLIEVSAGAESAKPQHGFGASEGPTRSGEVHAVRDQVAAGAFDHAGSDRESSGEALVVVQIRGVIEQIVSTLIHILPIVGRQLSSGGATSYPRRHQAGLTAQDAKQPLLDPHLAGGLGLLVEA